MKVKRRYEVGLEKLGSASSQVLEMQKELTELQPQLVESGKRVEEMMVKIEADSIEVAKVEKVIFLLFSISYCHSHFLFINHAHIWSAHMVSSYDQPIIWSAHIWSAHIWPACFIQLFCVQFSQTVKADEVIANKQAEAAKAIKDECDRELSNAMPILESAMKALNTITQNVSMHDVRNIQGSCVAIKVGRRKLKNFNLTKKICAKEERRWEYYN